MSRARRTELKEAVKQEQERIALQAEVDWTMQAVNFLLAYTGDNPVLRSLASRQKRIRNWVPNERQVIQIHRLAHRERIDIKRIEEDSLGRKLRFKEGPDLPDSLAEPDWL